MSTAPSHATIRGDSNSGTQIAQSYGPVSIVQHATSKARGKPSREDVCLQLFRLSKQGGGGSYEWYKNRIENRVEGTCQWFLSHLNYRSWKDSTHGPLLVSADPGCGKSVLAKYLIEWELSGTICYFFFKDQDQNTVQQALCALLHQLFVQQRSLIQHAMSKYSENGPELVNNESLLWDILSDAINDPEAGPVMLVLDALDECKSADLKDLIVRLRDLLNGPSKGTAGLKMLFTIRPYQNLLSEFWELAEDFTNIRIPGEEHSEQISEEVNCVIKHRVQQLSKKFTLKRELSEYLERQLLAITHRTYLWTYLVFDHLNNGFKKTERAIQETIETLPHTVTEAYEKILDKSLDKAKAKLTLSIILAAQRAFTIQEMNIAVHVLSTPDALSVEDLDLEDEHDFKHTVRDWCGLFIAIYGDRVYLIHQTAREFLSDPSSPDVWQADSWQWRGSISDSAAQAALAESCLRYIRLHAFNNYRPLAEPDLWSYHKDVSEVLPFSTIPFYMYVARNWPDHYDAAEEHRTQLVTLAIQACSPEEVSIPAWVYIYCLNPEQGHIIYPDATWTSINIACVVRLEDVAERLISEANFDQTDATERTPLFFAVEHGLAKLVGRLVDRGADILHRDRSQRTVLHYAVGAGRASMTAWLIQHGAYVNAIDLQGDTALHLAASQSGKLVEHLVAAGADITACNIDGKTPVHLAASFGQMETLSSMLDADRSALDDPDNNGWTALHHAVKGGRFEVAARLLEYGAESQFGTVLAGPPITLALRDDNEEIVELMLQSGGYVYIQDAAGKNMLGTAALCRNPEMLSALIRHGDLAHLMLVGHVRYNLINSMLLRTQQTRFQSEAISTSAEATDVIRWLSNVGSTSSTSTDSEDATGPLARLSGADLTGPISTDYDDATEATDIDQASDRL